MAKKGNMNVYIYDNPIQGSRFVGSKKKRKSIKRGK